MVLEICWNRWVCTFLYLCALTFLWTYTDLYAFGPWGSASLCSRSVVELTVTRTADSKLKYFCTFRHCCENWVKGTVKSCKKKKKNAVFWQGCSCRVWPEGEARGQSMLLPESNRFILCTVVSLAHLTLSLSGSPHLSSVCIVLDMSLSNAASWMETW